MNKRLFTKSSNFFIFIFFLSLCTPSLAMKQKSPNDLKPPLSNQNRIKSSDRQNLKVQKRANSSLNVQIAPESKMINLKPNRLNGRRESNQVKQKSNFNVPMSEINAQIRESRMTRKKRDPIDFNERNRLDLEKMKRFTKQKEYIMKVGDDSDLNSMLEFSKQLYSTFLKELDVKFPNEVMGFKEDDPEDDQIETISHLLNNSYTLNSSTDDVKLLENYKTFVVQFEVSNYDTRKKIFQAAMNAYKNLLYLMHVPKKVYIDLATKLELTGSTLIKKGHNNIKDRLETRNAIYKGNTVSLLLNKGEIHVSDMKQLLNEKPQLNEQISQKRTEDQYIEDMKEATGEVTRLEGLNTIRIEIAKNLSIKGMKYLDFGNARLGFTNLDTLEIVKKRYDYCVKQNGNKTVMKDFQLSSYGYDNLPVTLGKFNQTNEMILSVKIQLDILEPSQNQVEFANQVGLLILSKYYLSDFGFIGYTNSSQDVFYDFYLDDKSKEPMVNVIRILRSYSENANDNTQEIIDTCDIKQNEIISFDLLGERVPEYDYEDQNYGFVAFRKNGIYRFVFRSPRVTIFNDVSIVGLWGKVTNHKITNQCSYNSDDYYTGISLGEIFMISFYADEAGIKQMPHIQKKKAKKRVVQPKEEHKANKIQKGQNLNDLFKLLI